MEEEGRLLRPHDVDIWRKVAGKCAVCEIGIGSIRHRQLKGKYSSATQYPVGKMWHGDIVFLSTTRGAINFLVATEHQTGYTFHTLMEGGRTTAIVAQATQKLIEFCEATPVAGRGDTFRQRGCPSGTLGSRWSSYIHWNFGPP